MGRNSVGSSCNSIPPAICKVQSHQLLWKIQAADMVPSYLETVNNNNQACNITAYNFLFIFNLQFNGIYSHICYVSAWYLLLP